MSFSVFPASYGLVKISVTKLRHFCEMRNLSLLNCKYNIKPNMNVEEEIDAHRIPYRHGNLNPDYHSTMRVRIGAPHICTKLVLALGSSRNSCNFRSSQIYRSIFFVGKSGFEDVTVR